MLMDRVNGIIIIYLWYMPQLSKVRSLLFLFVPCGVPGYNNWTHLPVLWSDLPTNMATSDKQFYVHTEPSTY